jgi:hypothetical protein
VLDETPEGELRRGMTTKEFEPAKLRTQWEKPIPGRKRRRKRADDEVARSGKQFLSRCGRAYAGPATSPAR